MYRSATGDVESELNPEAGWSTGGEDTDGGIAELKDPKAWQKREYPLPWTLATIHLLTTYLQS